MTTYPEITVAKTHDFPAAEFEVALEEDNEKQVHSVTLSDSYYQLLTDGKIDPEELIRRSFQFLLEREPRESILSSFDLTEIKTYFPEFEEKIKIT